MQLRLFFLVLVSCLSFGVSAQSVQMVSGSYCVGSGTTYSLNGTSCTSYSWSVSSGTKGVDYNYSSNTSPGFNVSWLKPMSNIYVRCTYNCNGVGNSAYSANFTVSANAPAFTVGGGGGYCASENGVAVTLNGSQTGVNYVLNVNGSPSGSSVPGTGGVLTWANRTVAGNYTVKASTCPQAMTGSVQVIVNPLPTPFTVQGGGMYCAAGNGVNVTLNGSQVGVNYQLMLNGSNAGSPISGTGSVLTWPNLTAVGTYTASAVFSSTSCFKSMNGSASVSITNITPAIFGIQKISSDNCGPVDVQLSGSQSGVNYQLKLNGVNVPISAVAGGSIPLAPVSWKGLVNSGTYTVVANDPSTQCNQLMGGEVIMNPFPVQYIVQAGGAYCTGGTGVSVKLSGSEVGVNYQLMLNGSNAGSPISGTGNVLTWPNLTAVGTYTATAVFSSTSCFQSMNGSASVSITNNTPAIFGIQKISNNYCGPVDVQLSGSQSGVNYQLKLNGVNVPVSAVAGGSIPLAPMSWKGLVNSGTYTVVATDPSTQCNQAMGGEVVMNPNPVQFIVQGGGSYCTGGTGVSVKLSGSEVGVNYQLIRDGSNTGSLITGTGGPLTWPDQKIFGTYTASATYSTTSCSNPMNGNASVSIINNLPAIFGVGGGGCCGAINIQLSGSQSGVNYQLKRNGLNVPISPVPGGPIPLAPVSWKNLLEEGTYTVEATGQCTQTMGGSAIMNSAIPIANAGPDKVINLPVPTLTLNGSGYDFGGISSYKWTKVSGPDVSISAFNSADLLMNTLVAGTYVFRLVVVDNFGELSLPDETIITVVNNYNWIQETTLLVNNKYTESDVNSVLVEEGQKSINWSYFDGLGRQQQAVSKQASPLGKDIVMPYSYDEFGRERLRYLPYVTTQTDGSLKIDAIKDPLTTAPDELTRYRSGKQYNYYQNANTIASDQFPISETVFEASPLNRVLKQGNPGTIWQPNTDPYSINDKTIKKSYSANGENEVVDFKYDVTSGTIGVSEVLLKRYYPLNHLYANITYDEKKNRIIEFVDKEGRTICKKVQSNKPNEPLAFASTYYLYDDLGNLVVVLPPEGVEKLKALLNLN